MFTQTQLDEKTKAEFERGLAEGKAAGIATASTTAATEIERVKAEAVTAGATAERERIKAVEAQALPGHTALIASLKFDGKTTGPEAAVEVLAAERTIRGNKVIELAADAGTGVAAATVDAAAEAARIAAAAGAKVEVDPKVMAAKITAHIAAAEKEGRKVSVSQAAAEIEAAAK
jgi:capsid assembly protease